MIVIIGAGITGLSLAYHLKKRGKDFILIDKEKEPGGLCRSVTKNGYIFDYSGHFLHAESFYVENLVKNIVPGIKKIKRKALIYLNGRIIPYPIQSNLGYLSLKDRFKSQMGYLFRRRVEIENLRDWILRSFGSGLADIFFFPYNRKLWKYPLDEISADFLSDFVPEISLFKNRTNEGYNIEFFYPEKGIGELTAAFAEGISIRTGEVGLINEKNVIIEGDKIEYDYLISTIPLPDLLRLYSADVEFTQLSDYLVWNSILSVNIGVKGELHLESGGGLNFNDFHWIYFPEEKYPFFRVGSFSNVSDKMSPRGNSSIWVDLSYRGDKPGEQEIRDIIKTVSNIGIINEGRIDEIYPIYMEYGYPIKNKGVKNMLPDLKEYLRGKNIILAGRFGEWKYSYMEESILDGRRISEEICQE